MRIDFEPIGKRVDVRPGTTLLDAAQQAGIELVAVCGGGATCGTCRVRLVAGRLTPPTGDEEVQLSPEDLQSGVRLACQAVPLEDVHIDIPPQSLTTPQRTQVEGVEAETELDPPVIGVDVTLPAPTNDDLRSDLTRLRDALTEQGYFDVQIESDVLRDLSDRLRAQEWSARCVIDRGVHPPRLVAIQPPGTRLYGFAVDVGTTKLAAYLVDLSDGHTAGKLGAMNPQIAYGEDVVARIAYCNQKDNGRETLQSRLASTLNDMLADLCGQVGISGDQVIAAVIVGNTAMHHLFCRLPVRQLGAAPYVPAASESLQFPASRVGLKILPGGPVYLPPNIAGYVGADHVSMLLATGAWQKAGTVVAMDIGTNTEITLSVDGELYACSCASGPAFEGAHIQNGMRAAPGAIEKVQIRGEKALLHTIGGQAPVGLCGSGILDAVAEMLGAGIIDSRGSLDRKRPDVRENGRKAEYLLVPARASGGGQDIVVTREDINQIQLAKAAIRAGVEVLLQEAGLRADQIDQFIIAGAFGTYIDLSSAVKTGMFPNLPLPVFSQVGNAAGTGARQLLVSRRKRREADEVAGKIHYVELTTYPDFTNIFVNSMFFPPSGDFPPVLGHPQKA